ncbi:hypothetical protein [Paucibacter sp. B51]|uniref:hypothetical protein n=1 Tax=Paucibacter sp. B51 TaxID=2993315 RepID=UPI0022EBC2D2|nr:hypothetical protein [Paucibacter sp. B51]
MSTINIAPEEKRRSERQDWLFQAEERPRRPYALLHLSSHGLLLQVDARLAFLAGAWASVIVICQAAIEATLRDLQLHDYETKAKGIFFDQEDLEQMRSLRNELLHPQAPGTPSQVWCLPGGDVAGCHAALEAHAKNAYELMLEATYANREA